MSEEGEIKGRLTLDSSQFRAAILAAKEELKELTSTRTDVNVHADTAAARKQIESVDRAAKDLGREAPRVVIRTDTAAARAQIEAVSRATTSLAVAEGRLRTVQKELAASAERATTAELALTGALKREDDAAARAVAAEAALERAHHEAAAAAIEHAAAEETVEGAIDRVSRRADSGSGRIALWTSAIIAAVPALFPIAGVAIAGTVALGGLGAAGLLAGTGIARGFKDGSGAASQYRPLINQVIADVHQLQDTAAVGLLPGADEALDRLQSKLPSINRGVGEMADDLGRMLPTGLDAVVTLTERGVPLWRSGADMLARMVSGIDDFAHSDAYKGFIDYSVRNGPKVEQFLSHTLGLVGDIITAWAPYGEAVLPVLDDTVVTVGHLIKALGPVVPAAAAVYLAFRTWTGIRGVIDGITTGLTLMGVRATATGAAVQTAGTAAKGAGFAAAAGWSAAALALSQYAAFQASQQTYDQTYASTKGSPEKKNQAARSTAVHAMQGPSSVGGAGDMGFGAVIAGDIDRQAQRQHAAAAATDTGTAAARRQAAALAVEGAQLRDAAAAASNLAAKQNAAAATTQALESGQLGAKDAIAAAGAAIKQNGTSLDAASAKGRANRETVLSAVGAITSYGQAMLKSGSSAEEVRIAQDRMGVSLENTLVKMGMSRAAAGAYIAKLLGIPKNVSTKADLDSAVAQRNARKAKQAALDFKNGDYTAALKGDPSNLKAKVADAQHRAQAMAHDNYTAFLKANPGNANSNVADAARKARAFASGAYTAAIRANAAQAIGTAQSAVARINAMRATIIVSAVQSGKLTPQQGKNALTNAVGGTVGGDDLKHALKSIPRHASGATVSGAGTASSDSVLRWLSVGEEVTSNLRGQAAKNRPMLKAINTGDDSRIRRTAAEQYGTQPAPQPITVIVQARDGAPDFTDYVDVRVMQGVQAQAGENKRIVQAGYRPLGI